MAATGGGKLSSTIVNTAGLGVPNVAPLGELKVKFSGRSGPGLPLLMIGTVNVWLVDPGREGQGAEGRRVIFAGDGGMRLPVPSAVA